MSSIWDSIGLKRGAGIANITAEQKNNRISSAVNIWTEMGLSQQQIAYSIATM